MRRSAAPSFRTDIKKARFLPQIMKSVLCIDKENTSESPKEVNNLPNTPLTVIDTINEKEKNPEKIRSNEDVLDIIFEADSTVSETENFVERKNIKPLKTNILVASSHSKNNEDLNGKMSDCIFCVKDIEEAALYNVVWCKRSSKKHKTWEGDGLLIVRSRSAVLKDLNGKILDKGVGYKLKETESLEDGSKFFIGGKECEIQSKISDEEWQSGKYCKCNLATNTNIQLPISQPKEQIVPVPTYKPC